MREKIEVVQDSAEPRPAQLSLWKNLRMAATEMNKAAIQDEPERSNWAEKGSDCQSKTTELESDTHRKKFEISMRKTINPAFLPVFFHFSLGVILLFSWWFWWWRDSRVYWVWKINCWSELHVRKLDTWKFLFDCRRCWNSAVWVNNLNATSQFSVHSSGCTYRLIVI